MTIEPVWKDDERRVICGGKGRRCGRELAGRDFQPIQGSGDYRLSYHYLWPPKGYHFARRPGDFAVYLEPNDVPRRPLSEIGRLAHKGPDPIEVDARGRAVVGEPVKLPATVVCPECGARNRVALRASGAVS